MILGWFCESNLNRETNLNLIFDNDWDEICPADTWEGAYIVKYEKVWE